MKRSSLSTRLGLSVSVTSALLVTAMASLAYLTIARQLDLRAEQNLQDKIEQVGHTLQESNLARTALDTHGLRDQLMGHDNMTLDVFDTAALSQAVIHIGNDQIDSAHLGRSIDANLRFHLFERGTAAPILTAYQAVPLPDGQTLYATLSYNRSTDAQMLSAFAWSIGLSTPFVLLIIGGAAWLMVYRGLRPLRDFSRVAAAVSVDDLSHRISVRDLPQELTELGHAMNFMLHRLDADVQQLAQFCDDLAHELRSPISNLLGKAQVSLTRTRSIAEYQAVLVSSVEELERIGALVAQLLFLANVSTPRSPIRRERVDLAHEAAKLSELFQPEAEERDIAFQLDGQGSIDGDRLMVQRALSNLLTNALRHSHAGQPIAIVIGSGEHGVDIAVINSGESIPGEHLPHLFDRFYRVQASRSRLDGGTGLGLAIVRSIMSLHEGSVTVHSLDGSTRFTLHFPTPDTE